MAIFKSSNSVWERKERVQLCSFIRFKEVINIIYIKYWNLYIERGAQPVSVQQVTLEPAYKDMVMPDNFYSTTNNATQIYYDGSWVDVEGMMMDKCIVVDTKKRQLRAK